MDDEENVSEPATRRTTTGAEEQAARAARQLPPSDFAADAASFMRSTGTGRLIAISGSEDAYTDDAVVPSRRYVYEIEARGAAAVSDRMPATAETVVPPLRAARLAGALNVRTRTVSKSGYASYQALVSGWRFKPRCRTAACDVRWSDLHLKRIRATLTRRGAGYSGSYTGLFTTQCAGTPATSSARVQGRGRACHRPRFVQRESHAPRPSGSLRSGPAAHRR